MISKTRFERFHVSASGPSLRRRVAFSLLAVRLILAPVILLPIYYLYEMWHIVDRIVSVDAAVATNAQLASIEMLDARRAERAYFLLHQPADIQASHEAVDRVEKTIRRCVRLDARHSSITDQMLTAAQQYQAGMTAVAAMRAAAPAPARERVRRAADDYEANLNRLLIRARRLSRSEFAQQLHNLTTSFDAQVNASGTQDPAVQKTAAGLEAASSRILHLAALLETESWQKVELDHHAARELLHRSEWVLIIVSSFVFLLSVWVSFTLPRQTVRPLEDLKDAVDHAAAGNYEIVFDLKGKGEVVELANSVRKLIARLRQKDREPDVAAGGRERMP